MDACAGRTARTILEPVKWKRARRREVIDGKRALDAFADVAIRVEDNRPDSLRGSRHVRSPEGQLRRPTPHVSSSVRDSSQIGHTERNRSIAIVCPIDRRTVSLVVETDAAHRMTYLPPEPLSVADLRLVPGPRVVQTHALTESQRDADDVPSLRVAGSASNRVNVGDPRTADADSRASALRRYCASRLSCEAIPVFESALILHMTVERDARQLQCRASRRP